MLIKRRTKISDPRKKHSTLHDNELKRRSRSALGPDTIMEQPEDIMADCIIFRQDHPPFWKRKRFHFIIGLTVGLLATYGASTTPTAQIHLNDLQAYLALQLADLDIASIIPATDIVDELFGNVTNFFTPAPSTDTPFMPALAAKEELGLKPHFPVVLLPGIVTSGLESWGTSEKSRKYFRKRMWGTTTMFRSVLLDKESWTQHMRLDPVTGLDPPGIKVRAAQGMDAADYFVTGFWVWAKVIENLAAIGYDSNDMHLASYDWRLSFYNLEVRDKFFTKLKSLIETSKLQDGRKSVIVAHSMGSVLFPYFLKWAESPEGGKGGPHWTENHIEAFVNIAGPMVGVPKALTALLSGESRDTMAIGSFGAYLLEKFFSRRERAMLMRTWAGSSSILPKGGDLIWGTTEDAPDDENHANQYSFGNMLSFTKPANTPKSDDENRTVRAVENIKDAITRQYTVDSSIDLLLRSSPKEYNDLIRSNYSLGAITSKKELDRVKNDRSKWSNPLESALPIAPNMKIFCLYGVGLNTERSYYYAKTDDPEVTCYPGNDTDCIDKDAGRRNETGINPSDEATENVADVLSDKLSLDDDKVPPSNLYIDGAVHDPIRGVETGVRFSDGDGTVPVLSLGYMCTPSGGWRKHADLYNPGRSPVLLKEYRHEQSDSKLDVRGGSKAGDHVDILGNWEMTLDILKIVSNQGDNVTERILSNIEEYAKRVPLQPTN
ncbi:Lecithin:cholesterol acyltransferase-domain-containing protein [Radiomyces spectabilis]|uniref:Lecithin:cholesterol acyltransferase-domain-containing protein n=1 Tax=Radiomyces spectabilis TaxID=64574 RepID=UPI00222030F8|nr:Lecithin:cholesterol acyltransferase-domain-containing protein [Radiomyces spectabilis]KAI8391431.1 Lecithin:cholesterol acyltransferase-domain-containing protein [Radiomyces spectabilis]